MPKTDPSPAPPVNPAQSREAEETSSPADLRETTEEVQRGGPLATIVGVAGSLFLFLIVVELMYLYTRPGADPAANDGPSPAQKIAEVRAEGRKALTTYGWVDKAKGVARIPIDRAMERTAVEGSGPLPPLAPAQAKAEPKPAAQAKTKAQPKAAPPAAAKKAQP